MIIQLIIILYKHDILPAIVEYDSITIKSNKIIKNIIKILSNIFRAIHVSRPHLCNGEVSIYNILIKTFHVLIIMWLSRDNHNNKVLTLLMKLLFHLTFVQ